MDLLISFLSGIAIRIRVDHEDNPILMVSAIYLDRKECLRQFAFLNEQERLEQMEMIETSGRIDNIEVSCVRVRWSWISGLNVG
jgi:CMP-2-keto-3-deoxyoctulosonic acid synthetase